MSIVLCCVKYLGGCRPCSTTPGSISFMARYRGQTTAELPYHLLQHKTMDVAIRGVCPDFCILDTPLNIALNMALLRVTTTHYIVLLDHVSLLPMTT